MLLLKQDLPAAFAIISRLAELFIPVSAEGVSKFALWQPGLAMAEDVLNTTLPPKDILFPRTEALYRYNTHPDHAAIEELCAGGRQMIFGLRPCDMAAIERLDMVFLGGEYADSLYRRKRDNVTLVAMACHRAGASCFCQSMGIDPGRAAGADVLLSPVAAGWLAVAHSGKGRDLLAALSPLLRPEQAEPLPTAVCSLSADMDKAAPQLPQLLESQTWDELYRPCLGCGACTYLCPTCHCFDINTESSGHEGTCFRGWDSCMFTEYSRMAGGHNPRPGKKERLRNRYLHKLSYFKQRYGVYLCVGCGRCIAKCPVGMDISTVIERAGGGAQVE